MSKTATHLPRQMPKTFQELNAMHPLRPINDQIELDNAYEIVDQLAVLNKPTKDQRDYLDSLVILTEAFDQKENEAALAEARKVTGLELLGYLLENTQTTQTELARVLGIGVSATSMIVKGQRSITADHARALGKHFKLDPGAFIR
jgi:antitoxin component HigA of HigAB toxin-antitoxin module